jgi:peptide/nickel transport system permease protein
MARYLLRRILLAIPTLFLVTVIIFVIQRVVPGNPALALSGEERNPQVIAYITREYHLDAPLPLQYIYWIRDALKGNLGVSIQSQIPVAHLIAEKLPITFELAVLSALISLVLGVPAGALAASHPHRAWDYLSSTLSLAGLSIPSFWLGILLILLFAVKLNWLPATGYVSPEHSLLGNLRHMILPAFVLGSGLAAVIMRQTRGAMLEVLSAEYIRTARAKGLSERIVTYKHALRNALIPVITVSGLQLGALLSGAVVTEQVFGIPGFGYMIVSAVFSRDYPVVQGAVLVIATLYIAVNLLVDLAYAAANPKIRLGGEA